MASVSPLAVARHLSFIRETLGPNRGAWVEFCQRFAGGVAGESWCADWLSVVLDIAYFGQPPIEPTSSTQLMLKVAKARQWLVSLPEPEDLYFYVRTDGTPHHVGIVTKVDPGTEEVWGIAGNTSEDGLSDNGTGVYEHKIPTARTVYVRLPR